MFGLAGTVERRSHCSLENIERQGIESVVAASAAAASAVAVVEVAKFGIHFNFLGHI